MAILFVLWHVKEVNQKLENLFFMRGCVNKENGLFKECIGDVT